MTLVGRKKHDKFKTTIVFQNQIQDHDCVPGGLYVKQAKVSRQCKKAVYLAGRGSWSFLAYRKKRLLKSSIVVIVNETTWAAKRQRLRKRV